MGHPILKALAGVALLAGAGAVCIHFLHRHGVTLGVCRNCCADETAGSEKPCPKEKLPAEDEDDFESLL